MRYLLIMLFLSVAVPASVGTTGSLYLLNTAEAQALYSGLQSALQRSADYQAVDWVNRQTGLQGSAVPLRSFQLNSGKYCREYLATVRYGDSIQQAVGTACLQQNGRWQIAEERLISRQPQKLKFAIAEQQQQQSCPYASMHPPVNDRQGAIPNFHSREFHERFRSLHKGMKAKPEKRQVEPKKVPKLVELVAY